MGGGGGGGAKAHKHLVVNPLTDTYISPEVLITWRISASELNFNLVNQPKIVAQFQPHGKLLG